MQTEEAVFLTPEDLAKMLKVSERTLWRLLSGGKIPEPVRIGGSTRWRLAEVQEWVAGGCPARNNL
ncbi:MAG: helix-turn-helix domain-containing protein [Planctomycetales bacterium]